jgi:hypothetical protein
MATAMVQSTQHETVPFSMINKPLLVVVLTGVLALIAIAVTGFGSGLSTWNSWLPGRGLNSVGLYCGHDSNFCIGPRCTTRGIEDVDCSDPRCNFGPCGGQPLLSSPLASPTPQPSFDTNDVIVPTPAPVSPTPPFVTPVVVRRSQCGYDSNFCIDNNKCTTRGIQDVACSDPRCNVGPCTGTVRRQPVPTPAINSPAPLQPDVNPSSPDSTIVVPLINPDDSPSWLSRIGRSITGFWRRWF